MRKLILLQSSCWDKFSPIRIILKLTFSFQSFSEISRECNFSNESQIHHICENAFQGIALRSLHKNWQQCVFLKALQQISEKKLPYLGKFRREKLSSPSQNFVILVLRKFLPLYGKGNIWKKITSITKPREFSRIFVMYKIPYGHI